MLHPQACSTPFGITDHIGRQPGSRRLQRAVVLNAFRHHGSYRANAPPSRRSRRVCAQRLSASRIISAAAFGNIASPGVWCSTPFGITDHIGAVQTMIDEILYSCAQRLSASRIISGHRAATGRRSTRRCSTPFGITDHIGGPGFGGKLRHVLCAQRLSASRIISVGRPAKARGHRSVLNAFRHHGSYRTAINRAVDHAST